MVCVLIPRAALATAHTTAHHHCSILTGNSSLAFATREGGGARWGVQLANSPALCLLGELCFVAGTLSLGTTCIFASACSSCCGDGDSVSRGCPLYN